MKTKELPKDEQKVLSILKGFQLIFISLAIATITKHTVSAWSIPTETIVDWTIITATLGLTLIIRQIKRKQEMKEEKQ